MNSLRCSIDLARDVLSQLGSDSVVCDGGVDHGVLIPDNVVSRYASL